MTDDHKASQGVLTVISSIGVCVFDNNEIILTKKFTEAMAAYAHKWNGPVRIIQQQNKQTSDDMDNQRIARDQLSFEIIVVDFQSDNMEKYLKGSALVLVAVGYQLNNISKICNTLSIPCIYVSEFTLRARLQSLYQNTKNPFRLFYSTCWNINQERKQRKAITLAQGLCANGVPTYHAYKHLTPHPFLYFDNRILEEDFISPEQLKTRLSSLNEKHPIRLAFSGRLIKMKGVDHLVPLCCEMDKLSLAYSMTIFGSGKLQQHIKNQIEQAHIGDRVHMTGAIDFRNELLPTLQNEVDLFVCCHVQGDPSHTYLEILSCGLPIVGYNNEAFEGILRYSDMDLGRSAPMGSKKALAKQIQLLDQNRILLANMSENARSFATEHCFNKSFDRRIQHMSMIAALPREATHG